MRSSPRALAKSSQLRGVPYQCLPNTCAYSRNSPACFIRSNSASEMKLYHLPSLSALRGGRVVHETDSSVPGSSKIVSTSVDFPDPEGPETMNTCGSLSSAIFTRCFEPVPATFQFRILLRVPFVSRPDLRLPCREFSIAAYSLHAAFPAAKNRASCQFRRRPSIVTRIAARGSSVAQFLRRCRSFPRQSQLLVSGAPDPLARH